MQIQVRQVVATACVAIMAVAAATVSAQSADPVVGSWKLDTAKSTYTPGPPPKSVAVLVEPAGKGLKVSVDGVNADGSASKWGFTTQRDGKPVPVTGNPLFDTATTTQASPTASTTEYKKADKLIVTSKLAVSADGKTMILTATGFDSKGQKVHNVSVYTKQ